MNKMTTSSREYSFKRLDDLINENKSLRRDKKEFESRGESNSKVLFGFSGLSSF